MFTMASISFTQKQKLLLPLLVFLLLLLLLPLLPHTFNSLRMQSPSTDAPLPCQFPAIFNLGDSNSDTGGLSAAMKLLLPPNGETFFGRPAGRFCDGRLTIDFMADSLGLPFLGAYLDPIAANFSHGANFATSGSEILYPPTVGFSPFTLGVQLNQLLQLKSRSEIVYKQGGVFRDLMPKKDYFSRALYTVDIGQNDLTARGFKNKSADEYIPNAMRMFSEVIKEVYKIGGRYFWIHNTGPLGCLPITLQLANLTAKQFDSVGCGIPYNELSRKFNKMLNETVVQLRRDLPLAAFTYVDAYSAKYLLISQADKYGFEHPLKTCCGYGGGLYNYDWNVFCGHTVEENGTEVLRAKSCDNPSKRISWDGVHYTESANKWIFDQIAGGKFSDPPNSLGMACYK